MVNQNSSDLSPQFLKAQRYERAVSACAELFLIRGIDNVKMTDIADISGVGVATLYRNFGTKTGIAIEAMTFLWNDLNDLFSGIFDSEPFISQTGIKQLSDLLGMFRVMYTAHKSFLRLLGEFDRLVLHENIPKEELVEYEKSIINFFPVFEKSYKTGVADGTVRSDIDPGLFYLTYAHALMELCKKFISGEILPNDDFTHAENEIQLLIDGGIRYLSVDSQGT